MTKNDLISDGQWPTRWVLLLLLVCGLYCGYRAAHLAIVNGEDEFHFFVKHMSFSDAVLGNNPEDLQWKAGTHPGSAIHFLYQLLAWACIRFLPIGQVTAGRLPNLLGIALFLWGVWRVGLRLPTASTRLIVTTALLSNAFMLDFFSVAHGCGLALGLFMLSLSFFLDRRDLVALWLAAAAALTYMPFIYPYVALLALVLWLNRRGIRWRKLIMNIVPFGLVYAWLFVRGFDNNPSTTPAAQFLDTEFVRGTICSLVWKTFYDRPVSPQAVWIGACVLTVAVLLLMWLCYEERIRVATMASAMMLAMAGFSMINHWVFGIRYPVERYALFYVPLVILVIGSAAAWSRRRLVRIPSWGLLLAITGIGLQGFNFSHTVNWRECADIPEALLALQEVHQQTGQDVVVAISGGKWTAWYYAEHLLGLSVEPSDKDMAFKRNYGWLTVYEWKQMRIICGLPPDNPLLPGTTHLLINPADPDNQRLLTTLSPGGLKHLHFYPASNTTLEMLMAPQTQGAITLVNGERYAGEFRYGKPNGLGTFTWTSGQKYVGEFKNAMPNGKGTATWPDGQKYIGEFKDGKQHGLGKCTWPDGREYGGEYKGDMPNGQGTGTWPGGQKYVGEFKDGKPNGRGTGTWPDGRMYVGEFRQGEMDGVGKMSYPDGRVEHGLWKQSQFVGSALR